MHHWILFTIVSYALTGVVMPTALREDGVQPDPENCKNFYLCGPADAWRPDERTCVLYTCEKDLLFDAELLICNYPYAVDCGDRPNPDAASTTEGPSIPTSSTSRQPCEDTTTLQVTTTMESTTTDDQEMSTTKNDATTSKNDDVTTTTPHSHDGRYPNNVLGIYIILADDTVENYTTDSDQWEPRLFDYQQTGANVLFFTFINPDGMVVPKSFAKLAATRGSSEPGSVPSDTKIIFAIGGYSYSIKPNPWVWLTSKDKAEQMAETVATWPDLYGCDGIDLDIGTT